MKYESLNLTEEELRSRCLIKTENEKPCWICHEDTAYIDYCTEQRVCSEECMSIQNKKLSQADTEGKNIPTADIYLFNCKRIYIK